MEVEGVEVEGVVADSVQVEGVEAEGIEMEVAVSAKVELVEGTEEVKMEARRWRE